MFWVLAFSGIEQLRVKAVVFRARELSRTGHTHRVMMVSV